jgi:hypothetical protein
MGDEVRFRVPRGRWFPIDRWTVTAAIVVGVAVAMRVHNSIVYPVPRGYDSFGHVIYIWYLLKTGRIPLANEGWSLFHPPLFFAVAAAMWRLLQRVDPIRVMHLISLAFSLLGLVPAYVTYLIVRRSFPASQLLRVVAPAFVLFLPVCIYTAPMIGNEGLHAVLCAVSIYCLLRTVTTATLGWSVALGVALGLALLTKFTAIGLVVASIVVLAVTGWQHRRIGFSTKSLAVTLALCAAISGWYYARNVVVFGNPFQMSRDFFFVQRIENAQAHGDRTLYDYLSFDPSIFAMPSLHRPGQRAVHSVWTGVFANTWFDSFGGWFLPGAHSSPWVRDSGRVILGLAVVPTLVVLLGIGAALVRLMRLGWDDTLVVMLIVFAVMVAMYVQFTRSVPIFSALKASYLLPVTVIFAFWFALGLSVLSRWPRLIVVLTGEAGLLAAAIVPVFSYGWLFEIGHSPQDQNARGVVCYLAGFPARAEDLFNAAAHDGVYAAHENLASIALEHGDPYRALAELLYAEAVMPSQVAGNAADRETHTRALMAEYRNTRAYIYDQLAWQDLALAAARDAIELDPTLPEAHFNRAVLLLKAGRVDQAMQVLPRAVELDPGFVEARELQAALEASCGTCQTAAVTITALKESRTRRRYPVETGVGDVTDAGIGRRKIIRALPREGRLSDVLMRCGSRAAREPTPRQTVGDEPNLACLAGTLVLRATALMPSAVKKGT